MAAIRVEAAQTLLWQGGQATQFSMFVGSMFEEAMLHDTCMHGGGSEQKREQEGRARG